MRLRVEKVDVLGQNKSIESLMYLKTLAFMVGSTTMYGGIFYQVNLLPWITIPSSKKYWYCGIIAMFQFSAGSPQHIYQDMQNYVAIGLMKLYRSNPSDKLIHNSICVVF